MLNPDFYDILSEFERSGVEYLVVGAFALAVHGNPRATGDIDLYVRPTAENALRVMDALRKFGAPTSGIAANDFETLDTVFQIGIRPHRIDILTSLDGIASFDEALEGHVHAVVGGHSLPVLGRDNLIRNKSALGRPQDIADVDWLIRNPQPP